MAMELGGQHTIAATATALDSSNTPCRILTIRLELGASICYFGNSDLTIAPTNAHGYLVASATAGESWTFGPFDIGSGIKPSEIFIVGTADDVLFWNGLPA